MANNFRDVSRSNFNLPHEGNPTRDELNSSCLLRIADATEMMAKNYVQLQKDAKYWEERYYHERNRRESFERGNSALRGVITKLKKKIPNNR